jgi:hypothetical protein
VIALTLAALLLSGNPLTDLAPTQIKTVKLRVPAVWKHTDDKGTQVYTSPAKDAQILVDVGATASPMDASTCRNKIVHAMGEEGWMLLSIGTQPAAKKVEQVQSEDQQTVVDTLTYIGCNGRTTWSMQFRIDAHKKDKFQALVDQVAQSLQYVK